MKFYSPFTGGKTPPLQGIFLLFATVRRCHQDPWILRGVSWHLNKPSPEGEGGPLRGSPKRACRVLGVLAIVVDEELLWIYDTSSVSRQAAATFPHWGRLPIMPALQENAAKFFRGTTIDLVGAIIDRPCSCRQDFFVAGDQTPRKRGGLPYG